MVSDRLQRIHMRMRYAACLAQTRELEIESSTYEGFEDLVKDAANEPKVEDRIFGATDDALAEY